MAITPAALTNEKLVVKSITKPEITIGSVCASMFWVRIRAKMNSFQLVRNANISEATSAGQRQRQIDVAKRLPVRAAVGTRRAVEVARDLLEIGDQDEDRERQRDRQIGDDQRRAAC